jgi:hypothetical protein
VVKDMMRACVLAYGNCWEESQAFAEFSYNNGYHASLKKAPFEVLYGRKCRTLLMWSEFGERAIEILDFIKAAEEKIAEVRENLKFDVGDHVYLKVSLIRGTRRFQVHGKLTPWFIGPYPALKRIGIVPYKLKLPERLSDVHDIFHVSQLRKCLRVPEEQVVPDTLDLRDDL